MGAALIEFEHIARGETYARSSGNYCDMKVIRNNFIQKEKLNERKELLEIMGLQ